MEPKTFVKQNKIFDSMRWFSHLIKKKSRLETGFSMLEAVVVVGVLLALAVGGFFAYGPIVNNAKMAKMKSAASQVYTAITVSLLDGDPTTSPQGVVDSYNDSTSGIKFSIRSAQEMAGAAIPAMTTAQDYVPTSDGDFCVTATDADNPKISADAGNCPQPVSTPNPIPSPTPSAAPTKEPLPPVVSLLKNGDFSDGLNFWSTSKNQYAVLGPIDSSQEALLKPDMYGWNAIQQAVSVPAGRIAYLQYGYRFTVGFVDNTCGINLTVNIYSANGTLLKEAAKNCAPQAATAVALQSVDLTPYAGQDIKIEFIFTNVAFDPSKAVYLDNVQIESTDVAPNAPTDVTTSVNDTDATISWKAPISGFAAITSYTVKPYRNDVALPELKTEGFPAATSTVFKGLTGGGTYKFEVTATNSLGTSPTSPFSAPIVKDPKFIENGDFSAGLTGWAATKSANSSLAPSVVAGEALLKPSAYGSNSIRQTVAIPSEGITYLQYSYRFTTGYVDNTCGVNLSVKAYNAAGVLLKEIAKNCTPQAATTAALQSADLTSYAGQDIKLEFTFTNVAFDPAKAVYLDDVQVERTRTAPTAPIGVATSVNDTDATITWKAPTAGFTSVTAYNVKPYRNDVALPEFKVTGSPAPTSAVFKGMTSGGTYKFEVSATNSLGTSGVSGSDSFTKTTKLLENGDFTNGLTGWSTTASVGGALPTVIAGEASLAPGLEKKNSIRQTVTIPTSGSSKLNYSYRFTNGYADTCGTFLSVKVYNVNSDLLKEISKNCAPSAANPATIQTVDLTPYAGQDIKIEFSFSNSYYVTAKSALLDNIFIQTN